MITEENLPPFSKEVSRSFQKFPTRITNSSIILAMAVFKLLVASLKETVRRSFKAAAEILASSPRRVSPRRVLSETSMIQIKRTKRKEWCQQTKEEWSRLDFFFLFFLSSSFFLLFFFLLSFFLCSSSFLSLSLQKCSFIIKQNRWEKARTTRSFLQTCPPSSWCPPGPRSKSLAAASLLMPRLCRRNWAQRETSHEEFSAEAAGEATARVGLRFACYRRKKKL